VFAIIDDAIADVRGIVTRLRASTLRLHFLFKASEEKGISYRAPVPDVRTRWNSTYDMLRWALDLRPAIDLRCELDPTLNNGVIPDRKWKEIAGIADFLQPLKEITDIMSAHKYPTLSLVIPLFNSVVDHFEEVLNKHSRKKQPPNTVLLVSAAQAAIDKLLKYYNKTNTFYCIVTALDPR